MLWKHPIASSSHKKNTKKNRMKVLFASVTESREMNTGRRLCELFMVKPSKKDYPDYYKIILEPMDLRTIDHNIRADKYMTEEAMMEDMRLMFRNARHYNEEGSQVGLNRPNCFNDTFIMQQLSVKTLFSSDMALCARMVYSTFNVNNIHYISLMP